MGNTGSSGRSRVHDANAQRVAQVRLPVRRTDLKVLCLGLPRTGTASLREALRHLGYGDVYHFQTVYNEQPGDAMIWHSLLRKKFVNKMPITKVGWDRLTGNCGAVTDIPCVIFWRELLAEFPNAKVIITMRDHPEHWFESYEATIRPWFRKIYEDAHPPNLKGRLRKWLTANEKSWTVKMCELIQKHYLDEVDVEGKAFYVDHYNRVRESVPSDRLLIYKIDQGWGPLCRFLGTEEPMMEFPHVNHREDFPKMFADPDPAPPAYRSRAAAGSKGRMQVS